MTKIAVSNNQLHSSPVSRDGKLEVVTFEGNSPIEVKGNRSGGKISENASNMFAQLYLRDTVAVSNNGFAELTGIIPVKPLIIQASDFKPLFSKYTGANEVYSALSLKEKSRILTSKVAISAFNANLPVVLGVEANRKSLLEYSERDISFIDKLLSRVSDIKDAMKIFRFSSESNVKPGEVLSFVTYLVKRGHNNYDRYSNTKIWQQFLLELMSDVMFHSPEMIGTRQSVSNLGDETFVTYSLATSHMTEKSNPKIGINSLPLSLTVQEIASSGFLPANASSNLTKLSAYVEDVNAQIEGQYRKLYVNLNVFDPNDPTRALSFPLVTNSSKGVDLSIITNAFVKEINYSSMIDKKGSDISSDFGYVVDKQNPNTSVWQFILGKFEDSVLSVKESTGKGNSLKDISSLYLSETLDSDKTKVLTLESENSVEDSALRAKGITSGGQYYVSEAFDTLDKKSFNTSKLEKLLAHLKKSERSLDYIDQYVVTSDNQTSANYDPPVYGPKSPISSKEMLTYVKNKLSDVERVYRSIIKSPIVSGKKTMVIDYSAFKSLPLEDRKIRNLSIMCKLMTDTPTTVTKIPINKLKSRLFVWCIKRCYESLNSNKISAQSFTSAANDFRQYTVDSTDYSTYIRRKFQEEVLGYSDPNIRKILSNSTNLFAAAGDGRILAIRNVDESLLSVDLLEIEKTTPLGNLEAEASMQLIADDYYLDLDNKLSSSWIDLMKPYVRSVIEKSSSKTSYSNADQISMLMTYFDIILTVTGCMCPEFVEYEFSIGDFETVRQQFNGRSYGRNSFPDTIGYYISSVSSTSLMSEYYNNDSFTVLEGSVLPSYNSQNFPKQIREAYNALKSDEESIALLSETISSYIDTLKEKISKLSQSLRGEEAKKYLADLWTVYDKDVDLSEETKRILFKTSFEEGQLKLQLNTLQEYRDRLKESSQSLSRVSKMPIFKGFSNDSMNYLPIDDIDVASFSLMSLFFDRDEWHKQIGGNKKILSIGLPVGIVDSLYRDSSSRKQYSRDSEDKLRTKFTIKVFKIDHLKPMIVYSPMSFSFDMNLYPTRVISNWPVDVLTRTSVTTFDKIPIRIHGERRFLIGNDHPYFDSLGDAYRETLKDVYKNHAMSFLLEQYIKWFSGIRLEDSRYYNYDVIDAERPFDSQLINFSNLIKKGDASGAGWAKAMFQLPGSDIVEIPTTISKSDTGSAQKNLPNLTSTITSYFDSNETLFIDPLELTKRAVYPKKFDRAFNIVIDPDDFVVDETSLNVAARQEFERLLSTGNVVKISSNGSKSQYRHRDTTDRDVVFEEYFVAVSTLIDRSAF